MRLKFAGIRRKTEYSPNHEVNDSLVINKTAENLVQMGAEVKFYDEEGIDPEKIRENLIFSMVQGPAGIKQLLKLSERNSLIINSPQSIFSCYRENMLKMLPQGGIPVPRSLLISTEMTINGEISHFTSERVWIKRSDVHAVRIEDVISVDLDQYTINCTLREFQSRQIGKVIIQEHIPGDVVKFYAVRESEFFFWYYTDSQYKYDFDEAKLKKLAAASAGILGPYVYGGDAIISRNGTITIIDINDWPSFAPIRDEASKHISQLLFRKAEEYVRRNKT